MRLQKGKQKQGAASSEDQHSSYGGRLEPTTVPWKIPVIRINNLGHGFQWTQTDVTEPTAAGETAGGAYLVNIKLDGESNRPQFFMIKVTERTFLAEKMSKYGTGFFLQSGYDVIGCIGLNLKGVFCASMCMHYYRVFLRRPGNCLKIVLYVIQEQVLF